MRFIELIALIYTCNFALKNYKNRRFQYNL